MSRGQNAPPSLSLQSSSTKMRTSLSGVLVRIKRGVGGGGKQSLVEEQWETAAALPLSLE